MSLSMYDASVPVFRASLADIREWLDKPEVKAAEAALLEARIAPDMMPFSRQIQISSDTAKNAIARLIGAEPPSMPDTEASLAELRERCDKTIAYIEGVDRSAIDGSEDREVIIRFPNGQGFRFTGQAYLTGFALPNFFFHVTMTYALIRAAGLPIGKADFLQHLGPPNLAAET